MILSPSEYVSGEKKTFIEKKSPIKMLKMKNE